MELILWRHAEAEEASPDGDEARRLTVRGKRQARRMASWLRKRLPQKTSILVSPAKRAQMTARALDLPFETESAVDTDADVAGVLAAAGWPHRGGTVLIVGHQPTLGRVAAQLLSGDEADWTIKKGAVWWFQQTRKGEAQAVLQAAVGAEWL